MTTNTDNTRTRQLDIILFRTEACYPAAFEPASLKVWHEDLATYEIRDIAAAFSIHRKQSKYLPVIAEIIEIIHKNKPPKLQIDHNAGMKRHTVPPAAIQALASRIAHRIRVMQTKEEREAQLDKLAKQGKQLTKKEIL